MGSTQSTWGEDAIVKRQCRVCGDNSYHGKCEPRWLTCNWVEATWRLHWHMLTQSMTPIGRQEQPWPELKRAQTDKSTHSDNEAAETDSRVSKAKAKRTAEMADSREINKNQNQQKGSGDKPQLPRLTGHKGPKHPDNPPDGVCYSHYKHGKTTIICLRPQKCAWRSFVAKESEN